MLYDAAHNHLCSLQVSPNGLLSFQEPYTSSVVQTFDSNFTDFLNPIIAVLWADYDLFTSPGLISYRNTTNASILNYAKEILVESNPRLFSYQPSLAFIATWNEVPLVINQHVRVRQ